MEKNELEPELKELLESTDLSHCAIENGKKLIKLNEIVPKVDDMLKEHKKLKREHAELLKEHNVILDKLKEFWSWLDNDISLDFKGD